MNVHTEKSLGEAAPRRSPSEARSISRAARQGPAIAIIPARGGSKGIPRKNLADLCGKPLIAYSVMAAKRAVGLDRVFVSTEDREIAEVAAGFGAEVPVMRPAALARDESNPLLALLHLYFHLRKDMGVTPRCVLVLQPTNPFRQPAHISQAVKLMDRGHWQIRSALRLERPLEHFFLRKQRNRTRWTKGMGLSGVGFIARPKWAYLPSGYVTGSRFYPTINPLMHGEDYVLSRVNRFWRVCDAFGLTGRPPHVVEVDWIRGLDIDTPQDLDLARAVVAEGWVEV